MRALPAAITLVLLSIAPKQDTPPFRHQHDGFTYDIRPAATFGRRYRNRDAKEEVRLLLKSNPAGKAFAWKTRIFIFRELDFVYDNDSEITQRAHRKLTDADVKSLRQACRDFAEFVFAWSGGRVALDCEIQEIDAPLKELSGPRDNYYAYPDVTDAHIGKRVPPGTESVFVFWPHKDVPIARPARSSGDAYRGAGYTSIAVTAGLTTDDAAEIALGEWFRQFAWARTARAGYDGLPGPDDGEEMGYRRGEVSRSWMDFYRDCLTVYTSPDMWRTVRMLGEPRPVIVPKTPFVRDWLVLGDFPNAGDRGLGKEFFDERAGLPRRDEAGGNRAWKFVRSAADVLDLRPLFARGDDTVAYAHVYAFSQARQPARLWVGSDDGVRVLFNGILVLNRHEHRRCIPDEDSADVMLKPGWNRVLLKVDQGNGAWALCLRLSKPDGTALPGVRFQADRPSRDIVQKDDSPLAVPDAPAKLRWSDVSRDPWRKLPLLTEAHLRKWTGDAGLSVLGGDNFVGLRPSITAESPLATAPGASDTALNNVLNFDAEGIAWLRLKSDWLLVRADLMPLLAERAVTRRGQATEALELNECLVGRLHFGNRPVFVLETRLVDPPACEADLVGFRDVSLLADLRVEPPQAVAGDKVKVRLFLSTRSGGGRKFLLDGADPQEVKVPVGPSWVEWEREIPAETPLGWVRFAATGDGFDEVGAVRIGEPLEVSVTGLDGQQSWAPSPVRVEVRNRRNAPARIRLEGKAAFDPSWPDEFELRPAESRTLEGTLAGLDINFTVTALWGEDRKTWTLQRRFARLPWRLAGPFDNAGGRGFAAEYGPEADSDPDRAYGAVRWTDIVPDDTGSLERIDFRKVFDRDWVCAYAAIDFEVDAATTARLGFGSDDTLTVWLDKERIIAEDVYRGATRDSDVKDVTLARGRHRLLIKVCQSTGDWGFLFSATAPEAIRFLPPR